MDGVTPEELDEWLARGWRHFGPVYFRPACEKCASCISLRINVHDFRPSKSQRRAARQAENLTRTLGVPVVDDERIALYNKWHAHRTQTRGWEPSPISEERYAMEFAFPNAATREIAFRQRDTERLVGLSITDVTPSALSAVYFYWDPIEAPPSLGIAHILTLIDAAKRSKRPWVYLGYRVAGCASLAYKGRFEPHELLEGRPSLRELPTWNHGQPARDSQTLLPQVPTLITRTPQ